ncbi:hypothetical protein M2454_002314 [Aequitasia blattaphilus]|uniref:Uncharacterized protein n=1 Tax=Aequitasia blattaphilus TaxID=2949332 RepID=A0ABT1EBG0_9FIRM|nr:hypothetical protein [Aequitasia blattaphilus]MCP1103171.1 hypothetical protein [Aequitasia blattaphilus]MCR8615811.1 hypothetical protein [Aequitasia blattaphilus]
MDSMMVGTLYIFFILFMISGVMKLAIKSFVHDLITPSELIQKNFSNKKQLLWFLYTFGFFGAISGGGLFASYIPSLRGNLESISLIGISVILLAYVIFNFLNQRSFWSECKIEQNTLMQVIKRVWQISVYTYSGIVLSCISAHISENAITRKVLFALCAIYTLCSIVCYFYCYVKQSGQS